MTSTCPAVPGTSTELCLEQLWPAPHWGSNLQPCVSAGHVPAEVHRQSEPPHEYRYAVMQTRCRVHLHRHEDMCRQEIQVSVDTQAILGLHRCEELQQMSSTDVIPAPAPANPASAESSA